MFSSAPLVNPSSTVPRLQLLNESTDLNITKGFSVHLLQLQTIILCVCNISKVPLNTLKADRLEDVIPLYED